MSQVPNYPEDPLVRPVYVRVKTKGVFIHWLLPKELPQEAYKETWIVRTSKADYNTKNADIIEGRVPLEKEWRETDLDVIDFDVEPGVRYSYFFYCIDVKGNYYHPGPTTCKVLEDVPQSEIDEALAALKARDEEEQASTTTTTTTTAVTDDQRTRLYGMMKVEKALDLVKAHELVGLPESTFKDLIYDLVGAGKLEGEFKETVFYFKSDPEPLIKAIDVTLDKASAESAPTESKDQQPPTAIYHVPQEFYLQVLEKIRKGELLTEKEQAEMARDTRSLEINRNPVSSLEVKCDVPAFVREGEKLRVIVSVRGVQEATKFEEATGTAPPAGTPRPLRNVEVKGVLEAFKLEATDQTNVDGTCILTFPLPADSKPGQYKLIFGLADGYRPSRLEKLPKDQLQRSQVLEIVPWAQLDAVPFTDAQEGLLTKFKGMLRTKDLVGVRKEKAAQQIGHSICVKKGQVASVLVYKYDRNHNHLLPITPVEDWASRKLGNLVERGEEFLLFQFDTSTMHAGAYGLKIDLEPTKAGELLDGAWPPLAPVLVNISVRTYRLSMEITGENTLSPRDALDFQVKIRDHDNPRDPFDPEADLHLTARLEGAGDGAGEAWWSDDVTLSGKKYGLFQVPAPDVTHALSERQGRLQLVVVLQDRSGLYNQGDPLEAHLALRVRDARFMTIDAQIQERVYYGDVAELKLQFRPQGLDSSGGTFPQLPPFPVIVSLKSSNGVPYDNWSHEITTNRLGEAALNFIAEPGIFASGTQEFEISAEPPGYVIPEASRVISGTMVVEQKRMRVKSSFDMPGREPRPVGRFNPVYQYFEKPGYPGRWAIRTHEGETLAGLFKVEDRTTGVRPLGIASNLVFPNTDTIVDLSAREAQEVQSALDETAEKATRLGDFVGLKTLSGTKTTFLTASKDLTLKSGDTLESDSLKTLSSLDSTKSTTPSTSSSTGAIDPTSTTRILSGSRGALPARDADSVVPPSSRASVDWTAVSGDTSTDTTTTDSTTSTSSTTRPGAPPLPDMPPIPGMQGRDSGTISGTSGTTAESTILADIPDVEKQLADLEEVKSNVLRAMVPFEIPAGESTSTEMYQTFAVQAHDPRGIYADFDHDVQIQIAPLELLVDVEFPHGEEIPKLSTSTMHLRVQDKYFTHATVANLEVEFYCEAVPDKKWTLLTSRPDLEFVRFKLGPEFMDLPEGAYKFYLTVRDPRERWAEATTQFPLIITRPQAKYNVWAAPKDWNCTVGSYANIDAQVQIQDQLIEGALLRLTKDQAPGDWALEARTGPTGEIHFRVPLSSSEYEYDSNRSFSVEVLEIPEGGETLSGQKLEDACQSRVMDVQIHLEPRPPPVPKHTTITLTKTVKAGKYVILGNVRDEDGHPVEGAKVFLQHARGTNYTYSHYTDIQGPVAMAGEVTCFVTDARGFFTYEWTDIDTLVPQHFRAAVLEVPEGYYTPNAHGYVTVLTEVEAFLNDVSVSDHVLEILKSFAESTFLQDFSVGNLGSVTSWFEPGGFVHDLFSRAEGLVDGALAKTILNALYTVKKIVNPDYQEGFNVATGDADSFAVSNFNPELRPETFNCVFCGGDRSIDVYNGPCVCNAARIVTSVDPCPACGNTGTLDYDHLDDLLNTLRSVALPDALENAMDYLPGVSSARNWVIDKVSSALSGLPCPICSLAAQLEAGCPVPHCSDGWIDWSYDCFMDQLADENYSCGIPGCHDGWITLASCPFDHDADGNLVIVDQSCPACGGDGQISCPVCGADGNIHLDFSITCGCGGDGKVEAFGYETTCPVCWGDGTLGVVFDINCPACGGDGHFDCLMCGDDHQFSVTSPCPVCAATDLFKIPCPICSVIRPFLDLDVACIQCGDILSNETGTGECQQCLNTDVGERCYVCGTLKTQDSAPGTCRTCEGTGRMTIFGFNVEDHVFEYQAPKLIQSTLVQGSLSDDGSWSIHRFSDNKHFTSLKTFLVVELFENLPDVVQKFATTALFLMQENTDVVALVDKVSQKVEDRVFSAIEPELEEFAGFLGQAEDSLPDWVTGDIPASTPTEDLGFLQRVALVRRRMADGIRKGPVVSKIKNAVGGFFDDAQELIDGFQDTLTNSPLFQVNFGDVAGKVDKLFQPSCKYEAHDSCGDATHAANYGTSTCLTSACGSYTQTTQFADLVVDLTKTFLWDALVDNVLDILDFFGLSTDTLRTNLRAGFVQFEAWLTDNMSALSGLLAWLLEGLQTVFRQAIQFVVDLLKSIFTAVETISEVAMVFVNHMYSLLSRSMNLVLSELSFGPALAGIADTVASGVSNVATGLLESFRPSELVDDFGTILQDVLAFNFDGAKDVLLDRISSGIEFFSGQVENVKTVVVGDVNDDAVQGVLDHVLATPLLDLVLWGPALVATLIAEIQGNADALLETLRPTDFPDDTNTLQLVGFLTLVKDLTSGFMNLYNLLEDEMDEATFTGVGAIINWVLWGIDTVVYVIQTEELPVNEGGMNPTSMKAQATECSILFSSLKNAAETVLFLLDASGVDVGDCDEIINGVLSAGGDFLNMVYAGAGGYSEFPLPSLLVFFQNALLYAGDVFLVAGNVGLEPGKAIGMGLKIVATVTFIYNVAADIHGIVHPGEALTFGLQSPGES